MQAAKIVSQHSSLYQIVTDQIIKQLESAVTPWRKPWRTEPPCILVSGKEYRGINPFLLAPQGYASRYCLTFNQANKLGRHIRKGEKASIVTFWNSDQEKIIRDSDGSARKSRPFFLGFYRVFNVEQTVGIADKLGLGNAPPRIASIEQCKAVGNGMPNAPRMEKSSHAWYRPSSDTLGMPSESLFHSIEEYYSTLDHELTHSTGHGSRVGGEEIKDIAALCSESYSREELIAEMGAAMLCGVTGILIATIPNSAAYLQFWIHRPRGDSKLLFSAVSAAQKAADYIQNRSTNSEETNTEGEVAYRQNEWIEHIQGAEVISGSPVPGLVPNQQKGMLTLGAPESIQMILTQARENDSKSSGKISCHEKNGQAIGRSLLHTGQTFKNLGNASEDLAMRFGQLLTPAELAVRLKVSVGWIYEKRRPRCKKPIPAIPMGRTMRFDWFAVTKWLEELAAEDAKDLQQRRAGVPTNTARNSLLKK